MPGRSTLPATSTTITAGEPDDTAPPTGAAVGGAASAVEPLVPVVDEADEADEAETVTALASGESSDDTGTDRDRVDDSHHSTTASTTTTSTPTATAPRRPGSQRTRCWPEPAGSGTPNSARTRSETRSRSPRTPA